MEILNAQIGQFFTPNEVARFIAMMSLEDAPTLIGQNGFLTLRNRHRARAAWCWRRHRLCRRAALIPACTFSSMPSMSARCAFTDVSATVPSRHPGKATRWLANGSAVHGRLPHPPSGSIMAACFPNPPNPQPRSASLKRSRS